jgi:hypothetical protein
MNRKLDFPAFKSALGMLSAMKYPGSNSAGAFDRWQRLEARPPAHPLMRKCHICCVMLSDAYDSLVQAVLEAGGPIVKGTVRRLNL